MVKVTSLLIKAESALGFSFGVRAETEMKIWCVKVMHLLKVGSSEKNLEFGSYTPRCNLKDPRNII